MSAPLSVTRHPASRVSGANVLTVASGKGGVGKTWFSITLAQAISRAGRRVLLMDGDLGLANVDIQLGLTPSRDLGAVIADRLAIADAVTPYGEGGFDIVAGQSGSGSLAALPDLVVAGLRDQMFALAERYDTAILDLSAGIDRPVRMLAASGGICVVVTTGEPTALTDAYALIKLTLARQPDLDIRVVVNMAASQRDGNQTFDTLARAARNFLGYMPRLAGIVCRDDHVADTIRHQSPLLTRHPNCPAAREVEAIAADLWRGSR